MDVNLKELLKKNAIDYTQLESDLTPNNTGIVIAIENYYPSDKKIIGLSICLSYQNNTWDRKCWLSEKILNDPASKPASKPRFYPDYSEFEYNKIYYYPYSVDTSKYTFLNILELCGGLYQFVVESGVVKKE